MTRTLSLLFLFLFFISCGKGGSGNSGYDISDIQSETIDASPSTPAPVLAQTFDVEAKLIGFDRDQENKIAEAIEAIKKVIASDEFKKMVLIKTFNGKRQFNDNNGLTNAQIYKKMLEGAEKLAPGKNNSMDLELKSYFERQNVIGYTMPSIKTIFLNTRYLNQNDFSSSDVAMNLTHEWLHKLGFKHAVKRTPTRSHSVPYAIGYIMRSLAKKMN
jgi:hypothetical protein